MHHPRLWFPYTFPRKRLDTSMKQDSIETTNLKASLLIWCPTHLFILPTSPHRGTINSIQEVRQGLQFSILHSPYKIDIPVENPISKLNKSATLASSWLIVSKSGKHIAREVSSPHLAFIVSSIVSNHFNIRAIIICDNFLPLK